MIRQSIRFSKDHPMTRSYAAQVVQTAGHFESRCMIMSGHKIINAKSMLGLLSLAAFTGDDLVLMVDGADEREAMEAMLQTEGIEEA